MFVGLKILLASVLLFRQTQVDLESTSRSENVKCCGHIVLKSGSEESATWG